MNKLIVTVICFFLAHYSNSQAPTTTWGDEFKMKKGSTDLEVVYADKTGVFVREGHRVLKSYFIIGASTRESATLIKLDKGFAEEYRNDYNKELKGKEFEDFFFIKDKLYILASVYSKKDRTLQVFAAEINKKDGEVSGEWKEVTSWQKEEKKDELNYNFTYNSDSSKMIAVSTDEGKEKSKFEVKQFDVKMNAVGSPISISNEYDPKTFQLEDVIYTTTGNVLLVGRVYEYEEGKKKKSKNLQFKNYVIRIYSSTGNLLKEINTEIDAKWLVSTKVAQIPNKDIVLAAFYSNTKKGKEINGMLVQRINANSGEVISTSQKDLNTSLISVIDETQENTDDADDESKQERKEREKLEKIKDDEDGFSKYLRFRNFIYTDDNGIVILAEKYHHYTYTSTNMNGGGFGGVAGGSRITYYDVYECGDMMMSKMDAGGKISWLHVLPKNQKEIIQSGSSTAGPGLNFNVGTNYFRGYNFPFYAGLGSLALPGKNSLAILFNDNTKNENVLQLGQKVKLATRFGKTECYAVYLDAATGKYTRKSIFSNRDQPTAMPRLGIPIGKDFYLIGKDDKLFGKTKIAVGKITFK